jgi:hypothetical protein
MDPSKLSELLLIWVGVMALLVVVRLRWNIPGTGLTLAYLLNLSLIHLVGAAIYLLPAFQDHDPHLTEMGFEQSLRSGRSHHYSVFDAQRCVAAGQGNAPG